MLRKFAAIAFATLAYVTPVYAQVDLAEAIDLWLAGDDETSLPALAVLAEEGDTDARILLARIETNDLGLSEFRKNLSSEERRYLFRFWPKAAMFPKSWLLVEAARGNEIAQLLYASRLPDVTPETHAALWAAGERQATDYSARIFALRGSPSQQAEIRRKGLVLPELKPLWSELTNPTLGNGGFAILSLSTGVQNLDPSDNDTVKMARYLSLGMGTDEVGQSNRWSSTVQGWLLQDAPLRPVADLCRGACGEDPGSCALAMVGLMGGYSQAVEIDSPYENLIAQGEFLASPRARLMALRRAAFSVGSGRLYGGDQIANVSQCLANLVLRERTRE
ncbi:MAG: hypothetical protein AAGF56_06150 [Pseudomonadota bacterium]